jgi:copper(I)-binding protein
MFINTVCWEMAKIALRCSCLLVGMLLCGMTMATQSGAVVLVKQAWVRWLPSDLPAGGYLTLVNQGDSQISLIGASCADYGSVSLHQSRQQGSVSAMTPVTAISLKAHSTLDFAAEGYHLMLLQPKRPLRPGDRISITLKFSAGAPITAQFELRPADAGGP